MCIMAKSPPASAGPRGQLVSGAGSACAGERGGAGNGGHHGLVRQSSSLVTGCSGTCACRSPSPSRAARAYRRGTPGPPGALSGQQVLGVPVQVKVGRPDLAGVDDDGPGGGLADVRLVVDPGHRVEHRPGHADRVVTSLTVPGAALSLMPTVGQRGSRPGGASNTSMGKRDSIAPSTSQQSLPSASVSRVGL